MLVCRCWCLHSLQVASPEALSDDAQNQDDENKHGKQNEANGNRTPDAEDQSYEMTLPRHRHIHH